MTNYAQPQGIENWPEDLRKRYLEAMRKQSEIPMATTEERNLLMQQERFQSLLNKASPTTEASGVLSSPHLAPVISDAQEAIKNQAAEAKKHNLERFLSDQVKETAPAPIGAEHHPDVITPLDDSVTPTKVVPPKDTSEYDAYMKSLWGRYASDPEARKKMYLSQLSNIYAKSMLLDGWASITGGESRGSAYAAAATDVLDKTEKFDSEIRIHNIWKAAMFKDGKYYPPKTIPDFYERLQALGATPDEIAILIKGVSGKSFRQQAALEATPKMGTYYDKAKGEAFDAYSDDPRVVKGLKDRTIRRISLQSVESIEGKKFTDQMREHGKRYKMATPTERAKILEKAVLALEHALLNQESLMFRLGQITQESFKTPEGKIKTVLKLMGINDPSGGRVELNQ